MGHHADAGRIFEEVWLATSFSPSQVHFSRACDIGTLHQQIITEIAGVVDNSETCVFADIFDQLSVAAMIFLSMMKPDPLASKAEHQEA